MDALVAVQSVQLSSLSTVAEAASTCCCLESFEAVVQAQQQVAGNAIRRIFEIISQRSYEVQQ
jgi:hypothetical protein